jgi:hypothetical protein
LCFLNLKLKEIKDTGTLLDEIKEHTAEIVSPQTDMAVKQVAYLKIVEIRPLI